MLTRRQFCWRAGIMGSLAPTAGWPAFGQEKRRQLRVIAYNVFKCTGWPSNRPLALQAAQSGQMPERFANELALYEPDIINFSEAPDESVVKEIAERLGMKYVYFPSGLNWPGALLTRFEIVSSKNCPVVSGERPKDLFTRHWGMAEVRLPNGQSLIVHSAHLRPGAEPEIRQREISEMVRSMTADLEAGRPMLLIGDLNHSPEQPEYEMWTEAGWIDTFARVGKGTGATIKSDLPKWRIDYVWAAGPIARQIVESRPLYQEAFRLNISDPQSVALSDHLPQLAVFEMDCPRPTLILHNAGNGWTSDAYLAFGLVWKLFLIVISNCCRLAGVGKQIKSVPFRLVPNRSQLGENSL
jgi:endonuclease/exonuclease/phosphatase family metal-dependent hydrolase